MKLNLKGNTLGFICDSWSKKIMKEFGKLFGEKSKGIFGERSGGPQFGERHGRHWFEEVEKGLGEIGLGERTAVILTYFYIFNFACTACLIPFFPIFATIFRDPRDPWWVSLLSITVCWVPWVGVGLSIGTLKGMKRSKWEKRILAAMTGSKSVFDKAESEARVIYDKAIAKANVFFAKAIDDTVAVYDKAESGADARVVYDKAESEARAVYDKAESEARVIYDKAIAEAELRAKAVFDKAFPEDAKDKGT
jgi:vacuolar-type H+-ATPase subunit H